MDVSSPAAPKERSLFLLLLSPCSSEGSLLVSPTETAPSPWGRVTTSSYSDSEQRARAPPFLRATRVPCIFFPSPLPSPLNLSSRNRLYPDESMFCSETPTHTEAMRKRQFRGSGGVLRSLFRPARAACSYKPACLFVSVRRTRVWCCPCVRWPFLVRVLLLV